VQQQLVTPITDDYTPRHVAQMPRLVLARIEADVRWTEEVIAMIERGELP